MCQNHKCVCNTDPNVDITTSLNILTHKSYCSFLLHMHDHFMLHSFTRTVPGRFNHTSYFKLCWVFPRKSTAGRATTTIAAIQTILDELMKRQWQYSLSASQNQLINIISLSWGIWQKCQKMPKVSYCNACFSSSHQNSWLSITRSCFQCLW